MRLANANDVSRRARQDILRITSLTCRKKNLPDLQISLPWDCGAIILEPNCLYPCSALP